MHGLYRKVTSPSDTALSVGGTVPTRGPAQSVKWLGPVKVVASSQSSLVLAARWVVTRSPLEFVTLDTASPPRSRRHKVLCITMAYALQTTDRVRV